MKTNEKLTAGLLLVAGYVLFSLMPNTFANWAYDYLQYIPTGGVVICVLLPVVILLATPKLTANRAMRTLAFAFALSLPVLFILFRTRIHCFGGDGAVGTVPVDLAVSWRDFIPPLPTVGRLDTYGMGVVTKLAMRTGLLAKMPGMTSVAASQVFAFLWGTVYVLLALLLLRRRIGLMLVVLTLPTVFNFFGNIDCYPLPLCVSLLFMVCAAKVLDRGGVRLPEVMLFSVFWLFCGWVHPLAGVVGFLPAIAWARWFNSLKLRVRLPEWCACLAYGLVFFVAIKVGYGKAFLSAPFNEVPPVFSVPTFVHMLNVCILPVLPTAVTVLAGRAERGVKVNCLAVFASQLVCFAAAHFTQGANDQFPYSLYFIGVFAPWFVAIWKTPLTAAGYGRIVAVNVLVLVPMVWVHSTELTIDRAERLYPIDICKHNGEMSWQTHLGLVLGDNLVDSGKLKTAVLRTFENGARFANPAGFRGGNAIYHIAFHYHFGEFEKGRRYLGEFLRNNPSAVGCFLSPRPGFIYMNRQRLWDDILSLSSAPVREQLKPIVDRLKTQAASERYCLINPRFLKCSY